MQGKTRNPRNDFTPFSLIYVISCAFIWFYVVLSGFISEGIPFCCNHNVLWKLVFTTCEGKNNWKTVDQRSGDDSTRNMQCGRADLMVGRELKLSFVCALFLSLQLIGMLQTPHRIALWRTSIPYKISRFGCGPPPLNYDSTFCVPDFCSFPEKSRRFAQTFYQWKETKVFLSMGKGIVRKRWQEKMQYQNVNVEVGGGTLC